MKSFALLAVAAGVVLWAGQSVAGESVAWEAPGNLVRAQDAAASPESYNLDVLQRAILEELNQCRRREGSKPLRAVNSAWAEDHSVAMANEGRVEKSQRQGWFRQIFESRGRQWTRRPMMHESVEVSDWAWAVPLRSESTYKAIHVRRTAFTHRELAQNVVTELLARDRHRSRLLSPQWEVAAVGVSMGPARPKYWDWFRGAASALVDAPRSVEKGGDVPRLFVTIDVAGQAEAFPHK